MNKLIEENIEQVKMLCKDNAVEELYLFGSATTNQFNNTSDLDFAVTLKANLTPIEYGEAFLKLLEGLEKIFERNIDLVSYRVIKNPIFKEELDRTKQSLYAAA